MEVKTKKNCCSDEAGDSSKSNCSCGCGDGENLITKVVTEIFTFSIDGKPVEAVPGDKNIVDAADRARIGIPAPCYRNNRANGCCNACVVEINGIQKFACCTLPEAGMAVILNREDLKAIRRQRLIAYRTGRKSDSSCGCSGDNCCG